MGAASILRLLDGRKLFAYLVANVQPVRGSRGEALLGRVRYTSRTLL